MRKSVILFALMIFSIYMLSGCSSEIAFQSTDEAIRNETGMSIIEKNGLEDPWNYLERNLTADLSIHRYYDGADKNHTDFAISVMEEKYPGLQISIEARVGSDGETIRTLSSIGALPDIIEVNGGSALFNRLLRNGDLYVMDDVVEETGFYDLFTNGESVKAARTNKDGHQYGFGCEVSNTVCIWYNVELFEELGIQEPKNFEEFCASIETLNAAGKVPISIFASESWPVSSLYAMACIAEGMYSGLDGLDDRSEDISSLEFNRAAEKILTLQKLKAFSANASTTNYQQAYEQVYNKEAGYFLSGSWFFLTLEADDMSNQLEWLKYNPFADPGKEDEVRYHAMGGVQDEHKYSINAYPPSGLDCRTVALLGLEFEYWNRVAAALEGGMSNVIGDFVFTGGKGYEEYVEQYEHYESFTKFTGEYTEANLIAALNDLCLRLISGKISSAEQFICLMANAGY